MKYSINIIFFLIIMGQLALTSPVVAKKKKEEAEKTDSLKASVFNGLKWRSIGPAFASGRIADFAVNPQNPEIYYVAVASGHIWKTTNNGTTFQPVFDNYGTYSMGCLALDPNNPHTIWAGTGENNHQRALGYGNGVYKSSDGGGSWKHMGLKESRQIGKILIDPRNSDVVYVAAEGSAWGPGGERGLYKSTDGGQSWDTVLYISENTGINNIVFEPGNPDVIYATSEQRRRRQFTKIGGGPETAIYKSTNAGQSWSKLTQGIPGGHKGGMGIDVSPVNPDIVYVIIEGEGKNGGFFRSSNKGASFERMSDHFSSGQYYNEIYCDPVDVDKVYSMETYSKVTLDGGKTWSNIGNNSRHVDDHAIWIDPDNTNHFMIGGDGGIYESWDAGSTFLFKSNLPVTQYYRVNVDDTEPFYWVYGGTQDNNSMGGPSRNTKQIGVTSDEWVVTLGGDGFWQAIEPGNPDIVYSAYQYGNIYRFDKKSKEKIKIRPTPAQGELTYRWNWDAPFILSPHNKTRLYLAANKLFRSNDRGNSWEVISDDLTRNEDRNQFKVMGKYWPSDAVVKDVSTSLWGTIVSLAESPVKEGLLYAGTDDGLIQVSEDGGENWRRIQSFPGVPDYTYVSDIFPSRFDESVVYATFNNHKSDDFKPYVLKSNDKGRSWVSITEGLPENGPVHCIIQDTENENLLFTGTEFHVFFSLDGGKQWVKFSSGLPDIAVKDMVIQERENDLVIATFGRGFYILDDYSPLREVNAQKLEEEKAMLMPVKDTWMYIEEGSRYGQGATYFSAKNPPYGALFTYYLKEVPLTAKEIREEKEDELFENGEPIPQPDIETLRAEELELDPYLIFTIRDEENNVVKKIFKEPAEGINRINWDLRYDDLGSSFVWGPEFNPTKEAGKGILAAPGIYTVTMSLYYQDSIHDLAGPVKFRTKMLNNRSLPPKDQQEVVDFLKELTEVWRIVDGADMAAEELDSDLANMRQVMHTNKNLDPETEKLAKQLYQRIEDVFFRLEGREARASWEEIPPQSVPINHRLIETAVASWNSTSTPTQNQRMNLEVIKDEMPEIIAELEDISREIDILRDRLDDWKAPWTPGRIIKMD